MPTALAEYGLGFFALGSLAWVMVAVFAPKRKDPDLVKVIADNTQALTELTVLIRQQGELLRQQAEMLTELRLETARREARTG